MSKEADRVHRYDYEPIFEDVEFKRLLGRAGMTERNWYDNPFSEDEDGWKVEVELHNYYNNKYKTLVDSGLYFLGCPSRIYARTYKHRLAEYEASFVDIGYKEIDFTLREIEHSRNIGQYKFMPSEFEENIHKDVNFQESMLKKRAWDLGYELYYCTEEMRWAYCKFRSVSTQPIEDIKNEAPQSTLVKQNSSEILSNERVGQYDYEPIFHDAEYGEQMAKAWAYPWDEFEEYPQYTSLWVEYSRVKEGACRYFTDLYNKLTSDRQYFFGCKPRIYLKTYPERLKDYLVAYNGEYEEINFIMYELGIHKRQEEINVFQFEDSITIWGDIANSISEREDLLIHKARKMGYKVLYDEIKETFTSSKLKSVGGAKEEGEMKPIKQTPQPNNEKSLSDLITHEKNKEIVERIKIQYKNIKGKRLKLLLITLQELHLFPLEGSALAFHNACKTEFNWDIASYQAMNGYDSNIHVDTDELNKMRGFINTIISE